MNYDTARERMDENGDETGLWYWTTKNDEVIHLATPCANICEHHTREEAELHFYNYSLSQVHLYDDPDVQHKCKVCGNWTTKSLRTNEFWLWSFQAYLCDEHLNRTELAKLDPFETEIKIIYS